jgi:hypothetical protein
MFGAHTFGGLILGVAVAVAPLAAPNTPGADGGGFGTQYFGQYWPQVSTEPVPGTAGGGFGSIYFGQYAPGIAVAPPLPPPPPPPAPAPSPGGGGDRFIYPARSRPPLTHAARLSATLALTASAEARRRAATAAQATLALGLRAAPVPIHCGDDEACLSAAILLGGG